MHCTADRSSRRSRISGVPGREAATACWRSLVNVAIPQRRGSEFPMNAIRRGGVILDPRGSERTPRQIRARTSANDSAVCKSAGGGCLPYEVSEPGGMGSRVEYALAPPRLRCSAIRPCAASRPATSRVCLHESRVANSTQGHLQPSPNRSPRGNHQSCIRHARLCRRRRPASDTNGKRDGVVTGVPWSTPLTSRRFSAVMLARKAEFSVEAACRRMPRKPNNPTSAPIIRICQSSFQLRRGPRAPPPERSRSCASLTFSGRPPKSAPFSACIARDASALDISMNPKPRGWPVFAVDDESQRLDGAVRRESRSDGFFSRGKRQIANIEFGHLKVLAGGRDREWAGLLTGRALFRGGDIWFAVSRRARRGPRADNAMTTKQAQATPITGSTYDYRHCQSKTVSVCLKGAPRQVALIDVSM